MSKERNPWVINTEILTDNEIKSYFVSDSNSFEHELIDNESYLLEGCRGVGKTMLMQYSKISLIEAFNTNNILPVYVTFADSLKLDRLKSEESIKKDIFIRWTISKILQSIIETYTKDLQLEINMSNSFQRFLNINNYEKLIKELPMYINNLEIINDENDIENISAEYKFLWEKTIDITYFKQFIKEFMSKHDIKHTVFYFDEAAHTLFNYQQELFFTIFKKLKDKNISCKASVYPLITHYGNDFQPSQDAKKITIEKNDESEDVFSFFQEFYNKRISSDSKKDILIKHLSNENYFKEIAYASSRNPRRFLNLIDKIRQENSLTKLKLTGIIREHAKNELWEYHDKLVQGNIDLRGYAEIGRKFIEDCVIPKLQENNKKIRQKKGRTISIESEVNEDFKKLLRTLEYSGIINFTKSQKTTGDNLGNYYSLNLSLCFSENILKVEDIGTTDTRRGLSFTANSPIIKKYTDKILELLSSDCPNCNGKFNKNDKFCPNCGKNLRNIESVFDRMLGHSINSLKIQLVGSVIKDKLKESFSTIKDLMDAEDSELLKITHIGPKRLEYIKIAIRDYISG